MNFKSILLIIMVFTLGLSAVACKGQDAAQEAIDAVLADLSDIGIDLSFKTLDDLDVPTAVIDIPDFEIGSLSIDIDYDIAQSIPAISVPDVASSIGLPGTDLPAPPPGFVPDDAICAQFATVPDCSLVPEQYREICEQCKNR